MERMGHGADGTWSGWDMEQMGHGADGTGGWDRWMGPVDGTGGWGFLISGRSLSPPGLFTISGDFRGCSCNFPPLATADSRAVN